jgi:hypothetical protein
MGSLNERNEMMADANLRRLVDQRADRLIALGTDRGVARGIAAFELGLIGGDRIELDGLERRSGDSSLRTAAGPGSSFAGFTPSEKATMPNILTTLSPDPKQGATGHGKTSHGSPA